MRDKLFYLLFLSPVLALIFFLQINKIEPLESFSLRFNDSNFQLQTKEINPDIVFVAVDEQSVNRFGRWPWKREIVAKGVDALAQADVVLLDMIFSEHTSKEGDAALAHSLSNLNKSVCGFFLRHSSTQDVSEKELEVLSDSSLDLLQSQISEFDNPRFISAPYAEVNIIDIMSACTMSGNFTTLSQSDHLVRNYPVALYFQNLLYPSLGIQGLRLKFERDIKRVNERQLSIDDYKIDVNEMGFVKLNFYNLEQYKTVSFLDVLEAKVKPEYFKNKIVILGVTEVGAGDIVSTPIGSIPGPLLHYTFISNLLQKHIIVEKESATLFFMFIMGILPLLLVLIFKNIVYRVLLNLSGYIVLYLALRYLFVAYSIYIDLFYPMLSLFAGAIVVEVIAFYTQEKRSKFLRGAFASYLSKELLNKLIKNPHLLSLGGESKELSVLFSDIRGFTNISESMTPTELITLLNRYFTPMTNAVLENEGMLDKYIGDALMAFFNAPVSVENHADAACRSALKMISELEILNNELQKENIAPIKIGIGINTAELVVGNMGSLNRFNYTVIGDGVNLASRVESLSKNYGVDILITEFTVDKLKDEFLYRKIEPVKVQGKEEAVVLYQLMTRNDRNEEIKKLYDEALAVYMSGDFKNAQRLFTDLVFIYKDDLSAYFLKRVKDAHSWGIHKMTSK